MYLSNWSNCWNVGEDLCSELADIHAKLNSKKHLHLALRGLLHITSKMRITKIKPLWKEATPNDLDYFKLTKNQNNVLFVTCASFTVTGSNIHSEGQSYFCVSNLCDNSCKGIVMPSESGSEDGKDQMTSKKDQGINDKHIRKFSFSIGVNGP